MSFTANLSGHFADVTKQDAAQRAIDTAAATIAELVEDGDSFSGSFSGSEGRSSMYATHGVTSSLDAVADGTGEPAPAAADEMNDAEAAEHAGPDAETEAGSADAAGGTTTA